ncbi:hypothetical protein ABVT39_021676 [Epinephelus coioides]
MTTYTLKDQYNSLQQENDKYMKLIMQQKDHLVWLSVLEERINNLLIQANDVEDEQMALAPQISDLLPVQEPLMH